MAGLTRDTAARPAITPLAAVAIGAIAFAARLWPVLRGGGLRGLGDYDDGVYFSGADAIVSGRVPYRDYVLLHPPGLVLLLTPFAALGRLVGDPNGWAVARLAMMAVGGLSAALVFLVCRRFGTVAALTGGLLYAVWIPAVQGEFSTLLECIPNALLLGALLVLGSRRAVRVPYQLVAGAALGLGVSIKMWGVVPLLVVLGWQLLSAGRRRAVTVLAAAVGAAVVVCAVPFALAPGRMWWYVVSDQLVRSGASTSLVTRAGSFTPVHALLPTVGTTGTALALAVLGLVGAALAVAAWGDRRARVFVVLLLANGAVLVGSPPYFPHYGAFLAPPVALTAGVGVQRAWEALSPASPRPLGRLRPLLAGLVGVFVVACALTLVQRVRLTTPFPRAQLTAQLAHRGCVAADAPSALILTDVLSRDLRQGCPTRIDVTGPTYNSDRYIGANGRPVSRRLNPLWQRDILDYLESGQVAIVARPSGDELAPATLARLRRHPLLHRGHGLTVWLIRAS